MFENFMKFKIIVTYISFICTYVHNCHKLYHRCIIVDDKLFPGEIAKFCYIINN